jgi:hypothetical protein
MAQGQPDPGVLELLPVLGIDFQDHYLGGLANHCLRDVVSILRADIISPIRLPGLDHGSPHRVFFPPDYAHLRKLLHLTLPVVLKRLRFQGDTPFPRDELEGTRADELAAPLLLGGIVIPVRGCKVGKSGTRRCQGTRIIADDIQSVIVHHNWFMGATDGFGVNHPPVWQLDEVDISGGGVGIKLFAVVESYSLSNFEPPVAGVSAHRFPTLRSQTTKFTATGNALGEGFGKAVAVVFCTSASIPVHPVQVIGFQVRDDNQRAANDGILR